jgi:hypothetical protein
MGRRGILGLRRQDAGAERNEQEQYESLKRFHRASL